MNLTFSDIRRLATAMTLVGSLPATSLHAQKGPELDYQIHFAGTIGNVGEKFLREGLTAQDPAVVIWIDHPTQSAIARTYIHLDQAELQEAISPAGLVIGYMAVMGTAPAEATERSTAAIDFPTYTDTGDPDGDARRFIDAKSNWFAAHVASKLDHGPPTTE